MTVIVAGGTGFIGKALCAALTREGFDVALLSRSEGKGTLTWQEVAEKGLPPCEAVINLAGSQIMTRDWQKKAFSSRIDTTRLLVEAIKKSPMPPKVLIQASAVGYYPALIDETWTEDREVEADDFILSELAHQWEAEAKELEGHPTRLAIVRIGVVLGHGGGGSRKNTYPFQVGTGGQARDRISSVSLDSYE